MARQSKKAPTHPIRIDKELAMLLVELAEAFGQDVGAFVDEALRRFAEQKRPEAAKRMEEKAKKILGDHGKPSKRHADRT